MNDFFEKTLEEIVFEKRNTLHERGLNIFYKNAERQVYVAGKKIDILTWEISDNVIYARIIEFKREVLKECALFQAADYYGEFMCAILGEFKDYHVEIALIGTDGCENIGHITPLTNLIRVYKYSYGFDGIQFTEICNSANKVREMFMTFPPEPDYANFIKKLKGE